MVRNSVKEYGCGRNCVWVTFDQISINSTLQMKGLSVKEKNKPAEWLSSKTFAKHSNKPTFDESGSFSNTALESQSCKYIYKSCNIY